ncbi:MAG TPA: YncE family protein [Acidimicrobiia bacterium]|nr:YncE family protein [Acidimicrobiia bacterium]
MVVLLTAIALFAVACSGGGSDQAATTTVPADGSTATTPTTTPPTTPKKIDTIPGMPPVPDPSNLYSETKTDNFAPATKGALTRVYVPNRAGNTVSVIDPATMKVVDTFDVGLNPQHVVPSYDLTTLWVTNNAEGTPDGTLTPIDPKTGKPGQSVTVDDPYNMYFTPDGKYAINVAEARKRLDFLDPHTMKVISSLDVPGCAGINHADFTIDGRFVLFTCEFGGALAKIDVENRSVVGYLQLSQGGMPQDIRSSPDGSTFYVAEMMRGGVYTVDPNSFTETGFIPTGIGTHGLYPSRDGTKLYIANRGSSQVGGPPHGPGSVSVLDFATKQIVSTWPIPGGGSPDMGNVSNDGKTLWLSGRYDDVVYAINTTSGDVVQIPVGKEPHGLTVWPQPGRYSLGHTGNMR